MNGVLVFRILLGERGQGRGAIRIPKVHSKMVPSEPKYCEEDQGQLEENFDCVHGPSWCGLGQGRVGR